MGSQAVLKCGSIVDDQLARYSSVNYQITGSPWSMTVNIIVKVSQSKDLLQEVSIYRNSLEITRRLHCKFVFN